MGAAGPGRSTTDTEPTGELCLAPRGPSLSFRLAPGKSRASLMSAMGHQRPNYGARALSALPPIATKPATRQNGREGPKAGVQIAAFNG
jgi:hypothetical protein